MTSLKQNNHFTGIEQEMVYKTRYSKYLHSENRRENWDETITRYFDFFEEHLKDNHSYTLTKTDRNLLEGNVLSKQVMPSMRGLMTAGDALKRDPAAIYNCAFVAIDNKRSFDEILYTLSLGTGVGFSVEKKFINKLDVIADELFESDTIIVVEDSKKGFAKALRELISLLYIGHIPKYDLSLVRPAGSLLKTFGGRASGPDPLDNLFKSVINIFKNAKGRKLSSIECHDIACKIGETIIVGGVRRAALISLSDLHDERMRLAKSGDWYNVNGHRALANNSAVYEEKPIIEEFIEEWLSLIKSKSGERGIVSRYVFDNVIKNSNEFRTNYNKKARSRKFDSSMGVNPCSEIILLPDEFCNLTEVIIRETDDLNSLKDKVRIATILGTFQASLTKFRYINKKWQKNCEEERLLGVSMTGIFDNELMNGSLGEEKLIATLIELKKVAIDTNIEWADKIGIPSSVAITAIKPSGTCSFLNGTASGLHPRNSPYYIRYVRNDLMDPVTEFLKTEGVQWEVDEYRPNNQVCFKFPIKSPTQAIFKKDLTALQHLNLWKIYQQYYCEHKPSVTITVKDDEWLEVAAWVYKNFDWCSGVSFLPYDGTVYKQAPFTDCTKEEYEELLEKTPKFIDWIKLPLFEKTDTTTGTQELACSANGCEI